jgi:hypothetical protein
MEAAVPGNSGHTAQTVSGEHLAGVARALTMARILLGIRPGEFPHSSRPICVHMKDIRAV